MNNIQTRLFTAHKVSGRDRLKILILKLDHIGDFITALDAFRIMRKAFSGAEITLICQPGIVALAETTQLFDKVKGFSALPESAKLGKSPSMDDAERIARFKPLLDEPYFLAADFRHDPFDRFGLDYVDAQYRAAFIAQNEKGLDFLIPTMEWDVPLTDTAQDKNLPLHAEVRLTLLAHTIVESLLEKPPVADLFRAPEALLQDATYLTLQSSPRLKIGLSTGAGAELRKWKPDYWATLLDRLSQKHHASFVFFGAESDVEDTRFLTAQLAPENYTDLTGQLPLAHVPPFMNLLDAYIGGDTGLTHLAAKLGLPTINLFAGISNVSVWRARGSDVKTLYAESPCGPCHKRSKKDCPYENLCMTAITPDIVFECFEGLLLKDSSKT